MYRICVLTNKRYFILINTKNKTYTNTQRIKHIQIRFCIKIYKCNYKCNIVIVELSLNLFYTHTHTHIHTHARACARVLQNYLQLCVA